MNWGGIKLFPVCAKCGVQEHMLHVILWTHEQFWAQGMRQRQDVWKKFPEENRKVTQNSREDKTDRDVNPEVKTAKILEQILKTQS
jgi:hypothetical protein